MEDILYVLYIYWSSVFLSFNPLTTIRLVERSGEQDYVHIQTTDSGCYVWTIGNTGGKQVLNHFTRCSWGNMVHEFMHKLGITLAESAYFITIINIHNHQYYIITFVGIAT